MSTDERRSHVAVIGAGPGGYPTAFRAAQLGMRVTLVDLEDSPGGVCLYRGCIPSKTLLHVAAILDETQRLSDRGIRYAKPAIDLDKLRDWKTSVVQKMAGGLGSLARAHNIRFLQGRARFEGPKSLYVESENGDDPQQVDFDFAIVSTGSRPVTPAGFQIDGKHVMDSTSALELTDVPGSLLVVGGGYIGLELGSVYAALGSQVTLVEMESHLLPGPDRDLVNPLEHQLKSTFEQILLNTRVTEIDVQESDVHVSLTGPRIDQTSHRFDKVLVAVGRQPNTENLGLETIGAETTERGYIRVNAQRQTTADSVFAVGDVASEPMLAHKATHEAHVAVAAIAGEPVTYDPQAIPSVIFTDPEIAWCGLTESVARDSNIPHQVIRFPWTASGRAATLGRTDGLTKLIVEPTTERILGVGITGVGAGELIAEGVLAVEMGARADDLRLSIHPHPTTSETIMESAELFFGTSPHYITHTRS